MTVETSSSRASTSASLRRAVGFVAMANFAYFGVEFAIALAIGSVALFADSIDFLEDTALNVLILVGLGWSPIWRGRLGMTLAAILLIPGLATLWKAWEKFLHPTPPDPAWLAVAGAGALVVNLTCALALARHRKHHGSLAKAAFLSARNDALANIAIVAAGLLTAVILSGWPDLIVGLGILAINADAARQVWIAARREVRAEN
ncbi:MAG: cobalt transporter [Roseiflexus castenholzii]|uniref:cation transporter n=1 Tax=Roseiflexus castenholzii TaxID=120962 RepID=UPI000CA6C2FB|nr:MAG: cobalt transporter [Roseiflexus castenholzii]